MLRIDRQGQVGMHQLRLNTCVCILTSFTSETHFSKHGQLYFFFQFIIDKTLENEDVSSVFQEICNIEID